MIRLDLPVPPSANRIWRVGRGRTYRSPEYVAWLKKARILIHNAMISAGTVRIDRNDEVAVTVDWYRKARRGDLDNFAGKPVLDALKGMAFEDDSQVAELHLRRFTGEGQLVVRFGYSDDKS